MKQKTQPRHVAGVAGVVACLLLAQFGGSPAFAVAMSGLALGGALLAFAPRKAAGVTA